MRKSPAAEQTLQLDAFLPFLLSTASNAVSNLVAHAYQTRFGLTIPQWRVLAVLAESQGLTQQDLCDRTLMDKVTVSRGVQGLVTRKLVGRSPHSTDRRSHVLVLSGAGRRLVGEVTPAALAVERLLLKEFSAKEIEGVASFLRRIRARAEAVSDDDAIAEAGP
jgi:DNA-binding MarR family transcriptional regulator